MVDTARMEQGEPHFLEAREGITLTYDSSATGGRKNHSKKVIHFGTRPQN